MNPRRDVRVGVLALLLVILLGPAACGGPQSSPGNVLGAFREAVDVEDWTRAFGYLTPKTRTQTLGGLFLAAAYRIDAEPALADGFLALRDRHGLEDRNAPLPADADIVAILSELVTWLAANPPTGANARGFDPKAMFGLGELTEVEIREDRASGRVVGPERTVIVEFRRIGDRWFLGS